MIDKGSLNIETRVRNLKSYLDDIEKGIVQIPSFQRDFVWSRDKIKDLFDSLKNRYPIGSILFWKPDFVIGENKKKIGSYSIPQNNSEPIYILDGFQRLSTLFGCLTNPHRTHLEPDKKEWEELFNLYYDLEDEVFTYLRVKVNNQPWQVPVYVLMNSSDFRSYARSNFELIQDEEKIDIYYDRADKLSRVLLEYQIASIDIKNATIEEAVEIFSRINSKGETISFDWMANALSIKNNFRFGDEIDTLLEELKEYNFHKIDRNAIFRCIQSSFNNKLYIDNSRIDVLAKRSDFSDVTRATIPIIKKSVKFLYEELLVLDGKLLPYNIQLIFITDFFKKLQNPNEKQIDDLKKWFWVTSYSNYFTIYSLANQRKAYYHFHDYLNGKENDPIYNDNIQLKFSVAPFPEKITMGSVRSKILAIFMLNYSNSFNPVSARDTDGYSLQMLFSSFKNIIGNIIPIINKSDISIKKRRDLSDWLLGSGLIVENMEKEERYFINDEIKKLYSLNQFNFVDIFLEREKIIQKAEKEFTDKVGLEYCSLV